MAGSYPADLAPSAAPAGGMSLNRQLMLLWALGFAVAAFLISDKFDISPGGGLVFNEMLVRLLHGRFDISPAVIGDEAIVHGGRTYAYFGVFCALLRLPLLVTGHIDVDVTKQSMLLAAAVSLAARLAAANLALERPRGVTQPVRLVILAAVALGGESLQYLRPAIFQEVCSWGAALAAVFVFLALRRLCRPSVRPVPTYAGLAGVAGLALLCRVSFGLGLYAALGLMMAVEAWRLRRGLAGLRLLAPAALVLALFAGAALGVNAARWQAPLAFVPFRQQLALVRHGQDRLQRLDRTGELNLRRIPFALQYYLAPLWVLPDGKGGLLMQRTQLELFDCVELPPSSFLLSDPLVCLLAGGGVLALARRRLEGGQTALAAAALAGLALPILVMLTAISLSFRYRMDFYPALDFAACLGMASLDLRRGRRRTLPFAGLGAVGAVMAVTGLWLNYNSPQGPTLDLDLRGGWTTPILDVSQGKDPHIGHLLQDGRRAPVERPSA